MFEQKFDCGYEELAQAIVIQAADDYRQSYFSILENPRDKDARSEVEAIGRFFLSDWYRMMTRVDGAFLMGKLRTEVEHKFKRIKAKKQREAW